MKRFVYVDGVEVSPTNYEELLGYGTGLERAVNNACDEFYDGTTAQERVKGMLTRHYEHEIFIKEVEE